MRNALLLLLPLAGGCPFGDRFMDGVAFDTAGVSSCSALAAAAWPDRATTGVSVDVAPEVRFDGSLAEMSGLSAVLSTREGSEIGLLPELWESSSGVLVTLVPERRLLPLTDYVLQAEAPSLNDESGCIPAVYLEFRTESLAAQPSRPPMGTWWLAGDDRTNASAAIFGRLFAQMGDGYGLAPRLTVEGGPALALGTIQRSFGLPNNPDDPLDRLAAIWDEEGLHVVGGTWVIDDPEGGVRVTGLQLDARLAEDGVSLRDVHLRGVFDLRGRSPEAIAEACALGDTYGRPCLPCDDGGEVACLSLDARGMSAAAWTPPAAR